MILILDDNGSLRIETSSAAETHYSVAFEQPLFQEFVNPEPQVFSETFGRIFAAGNHELMPGAASVRKILNIVIHNVDQALTQDLQLIQRNSNIADSDIFLVQVSLAPNETFLYSDTVGFQLLDAVGTPKIFGIGAQGPQGAQGPGGGAQGPQGSQGPQGPNGEHGDSVQGPQGDIGIQGPQGSQGTIGTQGPQGGVGAQGPQGGAGAQGPQGSTGSQGPQGAVGLQGASVQGPQGSQGDVGPQGPQGGAGAQGPQGSQGPQGATGSQGTQGPQGVPGPLNWTTLSLASDFSTSLATQSNLPGLAFTPAPNTTYWVKGLLLVQAAATNRSPRPAINWPPGATGGAGAIRGPGNTATTDVVAFSADASGQTILAAAGIPTINTSYLVEIDVMFVAGPSVSGTFNLSAASSNAGSTVKVMAGSFLSFRTIP